MYPKEDYFLFISIETTHNIDGSRRKKITRPLTMAVFILRTHYPSGRTWGVRLGFACVQTSPISFVARGKGTTGKSGLCVSGIMTGTRRIMRPDELPFVVHRSRRISNESSSRRAKRLVPVFILETHIQTNYKMFAQVRSVG